jgi:hypothetical protein
MPTVLSYTGAFPNGPFLQHLTGKTTTVQNYAFPGAVQPTATVTVLSSANAFPGMPFLQHLTGKTATVEDYTFAGAVWPLITNVALSAAAFAMARAGAGASYAAVLAGRAAAMARVRAGSSASASLSARATAKASASVAVGASAALSARATAAARAAASGAYSVALSARSLAAAVARAGNGIIIALSARGTAMARGAASASASVALGARATAASWARLGFVQRAGRYATLFAPALARGVVAVAQFRNRIATATDRYRIVTVIRNRTMSQASDLRPAIDADGEQETIGFDYGPLLANRVGTTIASATITCAVYSGVDASPSTRLLSSPSIVASNVTGAASCQVNVLFGNCPGGVTYRIICLATTSESPAEVLSDWVHFTSATPN